MVIVGERGVGLIGAARVQDGARRSGAAPGPGVRSRGSVRRIAGRGAGGRPGGQRRDGSGREAAGAAKISAPDGGHPGRHHQRAGRGGNVRRMALRVVVARERERRDSVGVVAGRAVRLEDRPDVLVIGDAARRAARAPGAAGPAGDPADPPPQPATAMAKTELTAREARIPAFRTDHMALRTPS